ncbi:MAG: heme-binding domain-containing protein [Verrucomicrobiota bacterium]|nr:heme-binding domain-containing protein [Verrucomicrobiota bacterium]
MTRWKRNCILGLGVLLVGAQFIPVVRSNPQITQDVSAPPEVRAVLKRSCYDCHSNETVWPWYSKVAPVSWLVISDVNEGREHVNFSEWGTYDAQQKRHILEEAWEEVEEGKMPMRIYTIIHPHAVLSDADKALIHGWVEGGLHSVKTAMSEGEKH